MIAEMKLLLVVAIVVVAVSRVTYVVDHHSRHHHHHHPTVALQRMSQIEDHNKDPYIAAIEAGVYISLSWCSYCHNANLNPKPYYIRNRLKAGLGLFFQAFLAPFAYRRKDPKAAQGFGFALSNEALGL